MMAAKIDTQKIKVLKLIDSDTTYKGIGTKMLRERTDCNYQLAFYQLEMMQGKYIV